MEIDPTQISVHVDHIRDWNRDNRAVIELQGGDNEGLLLNCDRIEVEALAITDVLNAEPPK